MTDPSHYISIAGHTYVFYLSYEYGSGHPFDQLGQVVQMFLWWNKPQLQVMVETTSYIFAPTWDCITTGDFCKRKIVED